MSSSPIRCAMVFAAGLGTRMRPITEHTPKALIRVAGKPLLDYTLDHFEAHGCTRIVVNVHHLGDQVRAHLKSRRRSGTEILISDESDLLLETGGGVVRALSLLGDAAFFCANSDTIWIDGARSALSRLEQAHAGSNDAIDAWLMLHPKAQAVGYDGRGDFTLDAQQKLYRSPSPELVFTGLQVLHPRLFAGRSAAPFSLRELYLAAAKASPDGHLSRMRGLVHDGEWVHVGSPQELEQASRFFKTAR